MPAWLSPEDLLVQHTVSTGGQDQPLPREQRDGTAARGTGRGRLERQVGSCRDRAGNPCAVMAGGSAQAAARLDSSRVWVPCNDEEPAGAGSGEDGRCTGLCSVPPPRWGTSTPTVPYSPADKP